MKHTRSEEHFQETRKYLAGGVGSDFRLTPGQAPICYSRAAGSRMYDVDGNEYIDYILAAGPLILGHCPPRVVQAVREQLELGSMFGAAAEGEDRLARMVCECIPSLDMVSFTNSGSEAAHMALRLARAFTGKPKILKLEGGWHGWFDDVMFSVHPQGLGAMGLEENPRPFPESPGLTPSGPSNVLIAPWNRPEVMEKIFRRHGGEIAALILEPIPANNGLMPPDEGMLELLRDLTRRHDSLLIFDEIVTGFRVALGGAQAYYNVLPDLTTFGKAMGAGYPIAGFGGTKEVMDLIADGKVGRMGTYNSNSLCVAASIAALEELSHDDAAAVKRMNSTGERLIAGLKQVFNRKGLPVVIQGVGSVFSVFFTDRPVKSYRDTARLSSELYRKFATRLVEKGIRLLVSDRGLWFVSAAHTEEDIDETLEKAADTLKQI